MERRRRQHLTIYAERFEPACPRLALRLTFRDRLMNHISGDVGTRHYDRYSYLDEKRAALALWEDSLSKILEPQNAA